MSWTLVRHKNGREVPIKVSVFDAFRSESSWEKKNRSSRSLMKGGADRVSFKLTNKPKANTKAQVISKGQAHSTTTNSYSNKETETWTTKDDEKLRELKEGGTSWKQIVAALGNNHNSESQAKARWKEIEGKPSTGGGTATNNNNQDEAKEARKEKDKAEGLAKQAATKDGKKGKKSMLKKGNDKPAATSQEHDIKSLAAKYEKNKWLAVASRHFDQTGQRISPEMAEAMCLAKD